MNEVVDSLIITGGCAAMAILCTFQLRNDDRARNSAERLLRSRGRPVTPAAIAQVLRWQKVATIFGLVMAVAISALGVVALVIGVMAVATGR